jgi:hypothetical protein
MKRLILFLAFAAVAFAAITPVTSVNCAAPASATSCTLAASPLFGDVLIAVTGDTTTAITLVSGWTNISSTATTRSMRAAWKFAIGTETTCGAWTNATVAYCMDYRGTDLQSAGPIGGVSTATGTSATLAYNTITMTRTNGTSWVVGCAWTNAATNADAAPSGMTLRSGTSNAAFACSDTNGGVSSWATTDVTITNVAWRSIVFELLALPASTSVSSNLAHVFHTSIPGQACTGSCILTLPLPASSGTNNLLNVAVVWANSSTPPTISNVYCNADTGHATWTWTLAENATDSGNDTEISDYYIPGAAANCTSVNIEWSGVWSNGAEAVYTEWYGMATSSALDTGIAAGATSAPIMSAGSITTGTSGDVIYEHCSADALSQGFSTSTNIFGSAGLLAPDMNGGLASLAFVQTTAGAIEPYLDILGTTAGICVTVAFKTSNGAGTAPAGVQIVQDIGFAVAGATTQNMQVHMINANDALVIVGLGDQAPGAAQFTGISDSAGNSYTIHSSTTGNGGYPAWALDCQAKAGDSYVTLTGSTAADEYNYVVLEVSGINNTSHTSCYDSTAGLATASGTSTPYSSAPSITPSTSGGVILALTNFGTGPATAVTSPSGAVYAYPTYTGMTDASLMTEGGGFSYLYNASTSAKSWAWTNANNAAWVASAIALEAAVSSCITYIGLLGVGCR